MSGNEEELILLNDLYKILKEDASEVTDLIVKGINSYKIDAYLAIAFGVFALWNLNNHIALSSLLGMAFWTFLAVLIFIAGVYCFYKSRQLKKKYQEFINIHESLTED